MKNAVRTAPLPLLNQLADNMFSQLAEQMAAQEGITEQFKADDQMRWVGLMNTCKARAEESIYA